MLFLASLDRREYKEKTVDQSLSIRVGGCERGEDNKVWEPVFVFPSFFFFSSFFLFFFFSFFQRAEHDSLRWDKNRHNTRWDSCIVLET
jgi:hypothetical protein